MSEYQFPPTTWQYSAWSLNGTGVAWLIVTIVVAACSVKGHASKIAYVFWPICLAVFSLELLHKHRLLSDPYRQIVPIHYCLNAAVVVMAFVAMVRTWRARTHAGYAFESLILFVSAVFVIGQFNAYSWPASRRTQCKNNMKSIGLAMHLYHDVHSHFPPARSGTPSVSWRIALLPFLEQNEVYSEYDQTAEWDSASNRPLSTMKISGYDCPQRPVGRDRNEAGQFLTSYVAPVGFKTIMGGNRGASMRDVTDGVSNTMLIVEACGSEIVWTSPWDIAVTSDSVSVNLPTKQIDHSDSLLSSYHNGGVNVGLADGSVRFVSEDIDPKVLAALLTKDGGDSVGEDWWP